MPYTFSPPGFGRASKIVTSCPCRTRHERARQTQADPAPAPRCATQVAAARANGAIALHQPVRGMALQRADLDRFGLLGSTRARSHNSLVGQTRRSFPKDVRFKNCLR